MSRQWPVIKEWAMVVSCLRVAVVYLMLGVVMGVAMGVTHRFEYAPVHAHINLLGWVSLGLFALIYHMLPQAAMTRLARWHFWLHNIGVPVFMVSLFLLRSGVEQAETFVRLGGSVTFVGLILFAVNLLRALAAANRAPARAE
jgi:cbb3-type cytochrome oxidase subunit 1